MTQVTDPELIQQLEAIRLKQSGTSAPPAQPSVPGAVTDPILLRQLEAERSGFMSPQAGEQWTAMTPKGRRQYRMTENGLESSALGWQKEAPNTLRGSGQKIGEWLPVTDEAELAEAAKSARARLPGLTYGTGGVKAGAKQVLLDLATTDQKTQADYLVKDLTPKKGYMFVPIEDDRVMVVHKDPETGKVTRRLINSAGISVGDLVNAAPQLAAAAATGGAASGLGLLGRAAAQTAAGAVVSAAQEGGLKATGSERDFDWMKVAVDAAMGAGGELLASAVSSAARQNGMIRNALEDVFVRNRPPEMTPELRAALQRANIDPADFTAMTGRQQRVTGRRLQAAQTHRGAVSEDANTVASNTTFARAQGVEPNAFEVGPNVDEKALYAASQRGEYGPDAQRVAEGLRARTEDGTRAFIEEGDEAVAAMHGGRPYGSQRDAVDAFGRRLTGAADTAQAAASQRFSQIPAYRPGVFQPDALQALDNRLDNLIRSGQVQQDTPGAEAVRVVRDWLRRVPREVEGTPSPERAFDAIRTEISQLRSRQGDRAAIGVRDVQRQLDEWFDVTINQPRGTRYGMSNLAGGNPQEVAAANRQYAEYVADYVANRPVGPRGALTGPETAGDDVARVITMYAETPEQLAQSLLGRTRGLSATDRDTLERLVLHMRHRVAAAPHHAATTGNRDAAGAWDALRQAVWRNATRDADGALRPADRIADFLPNSRTMGHLFNRQERQILDAYRRLAGIMDSAPRTLRSAGHRGRVETGGATGQIHRSSRGLQSMLNYVFRYRAVRNLHDQNIVGAITNSALSLIPGRFNVWLENFTTASILHRARDPLFSIAKVRSAATPGGRLTARAMAELIVNSLPEGPRDEAEQTFINDVKSILKSE